MELVKGVYEAILNDKVDYVNDNMHKKIVEQLIRADEGTSKVLIKDGKWDGKKTEQADAIVKLAKK